MTMEELRRPRRLRVGDRVAVVAPSGPFDAELLDKGCALLSSWGLDVVLGSHVLDHHEMFDYLAGDDVGRAADLQRAWCDPDVAAVFCASGGYGAQRALERVDWAAMARATTAQGPKAFLGFSDVTALHEAFATHLGVTTLSGPMMTSRTLNSDTATREHLWRTLFEPESAQLLATNVEVLIPGQARGVTVGGTASLLASSIGTPGMRTSAQRAICVLEDLGEEPYRVDRIFTQLLRAGWLDGVAAIVLGHWTGCGEADAIWRLARDRFNHLGVPVVAGVPYGHGTPQLTLPMGLPAEVDSAARTLTLTRPALAALW